MRFFLTKKKEIILLLKQILLSNSFKKELKGLKFDRILRDELGTIQISNTQNMFIDERSARKLYEKYFKER